MATKWRKKLKQHRRGALLFLGSSIKFQGHTGWKIDDLNPIWVRLLGRSQLWNPSDLPCFPICAWINAWVNNREAGDLRRHRAHYDVTVVIYHIVIVMKTLGYFKINDNERWRWWNIHCLTHWVLVTHICIIKLTTVGSDNGLSPGCCRAII